MNVQVVEFCNIWLTIFERVSDSDHLSVDVLCFIIIALSIAIRCGWLQMNHVLP